MASNYYDVPTKQFRWNWGAFTNPISFGFANRTYRTILAFFPCLIPCLTAILWACKIVPGFVVLASLPLLFAWNVSCGLFAERWVWTTGQFEDGATFRAVMDSWNRAGLLKFAACMIHLILVVIAVTAAFVLAKEYILAALTTLVA